MTRRNKIIVKTLTVKYEIRILSYPVRRTAQIVFGEQFFFSNQNGEFLHEIFRDSY